MFSKINAWIHLWLGLASGIVVFLLSVTGCILVFQQELSDWVSPWKHVEARGSDQVLPPSALLKSVNDAFPDMEVHSAWYYGLDKSVKVSINSDSLLYVNPYTAEIIAIVDHEDFFHFIEEGHFHLWLGRKYGEPIVEWGTAIFFLLLISGLILWYPRKWSKGNFNKSFKIKWRASFKRVNYDLHNVLGFYSIILLLIIALSGMVMSFTWVRNSVYWVSSSGKSMPAQERKKEQKEDKPVTTLDEAILLKNTDILWDKVRKEYATYNKEAVIVDYPKDASRTLNFCTDMHNGSWRYLYFDPLTMELLPNSQTMIDNDTPEGWMMRSNYSLHTGLVLGTTTKILYFIASFISASLPITGFLVWWGRWKKKSRKAQKSGKRGATN